jgi:hypothetical protein
MSIHIETQSTPNYLKMIKNQEHYPMGWHEVQGQLVRVDRLLRSGISELSYYQTSRRSNKAQEKIAREVNGSISDASTLDTIVGVEAVQALGMRFRGETSIFDVKGNPSEELQSVFNDKVAGEWLKGVYRGDRLGYPNQLGKNWYLVFWGEGEHIGTHFAPVSGIQDFTLKPFNIGF